MIPNPENNLEGLENDVATVLQQASLFSGLQMPDGTAFKVLTEDEGDTQFEFDQQIAQLGLSIMVHSPTGKVEQPDMPGPVLTSLGFDVWVSEAPIFNRAPGGTNVRLFKAMITVMGTLHGFQPQSVGSPVYCTGYDKDRERIYVSDRDKLEDSILVISRIVHFIAPQVAAEITSP